MAPGHQVDRHTLMHPWVYETSAPCPWVQAHTTAQHCAKYCVRYLAGRGARKIIFNRAKARAQQERVIAPYPCKKRPKPGQRQLGTMY